MAKLPAILLALAVIGGLSAAAFAAGVEGWFEVDLWAWPQTTTAEVSTLDFDLQSLLQLDLVVSGLAVGNHLTMGVAGVEHDIVSLETTIGALDLRDRFVFAAPFIGCPWYWPESYYYIDLFGTTGPFSGCRRVGGLLFVKKRVYAALSEGILLGGLLLLEDANFPDPTQATLTPEQDPDGDGLYEADEQSFRFGSILKMLGTTVAGTDIKAELGFCADWLIWVPLLLEMPKFYWLNDPAVLEEAANGIKGYRWHETVCKDGPRVKEALSIEYLQLIPGLDIDAFAITRLNPFAFDLHIRANYTLPLELGTVSTWFHLGQDLALAGPAATAVLLELQGLKLLWYDADGDWAMSPSDTLVSFLKLKLQEASFLMGALAAPGLGLQALLLEGDLPIALADSEPAGELEITARWATPTYAASYGEAVAQEGLAWDAIDFYLAKRLRDISLGIEARFGARYAGRGTASDPYRIVGHGLRALDLWLELGWWV